jgi:hypothetical protein
MVAGFGAGAVVSPECHQIQPATTNPTSTSSQGKRLRGLLRESGRRYLIRRRTARFSHKCSGLPKHYLARTPGQARRPRGTLARGRPLAGRRGNLRRKSAATFSGAATSPCYGGLWCAACGMHSGNGAAGRRKKPAKDTEIKVLRFINALAYRRQGRSPYAAPTRSLGATVLLSIHSHGDPIPMGVDR